MGVFTIRAVTSLEEFERLADPWNALLKQAGADNIFLTWEWLYTWAKHYLGDHRLWIILVYKGESQLVGIAPFYIRRVNTYGVFSLREMRFLGSEGVGSAYLDFIVPKPNKKAVLEHIYRYLHDEVGRVWDTLTLSEIPAESSTVDFWDSFNQEAGKVLEIVGTTACPLIELTGRLEDFLKGISRNKRYNLQRKRKRLERAGSVVYERASPIHDGGKALETFIELHRMRWGQKAPNGTFGSQRFLAFHQEIATLFGERGWIRLDFLRLNGEAIAGIYGYSCHGRYSFYLPGFNPTICPEASPGILLLFHCIKEAIAERHKQFDLLWGAADYKMAWANGLRRSLTLRHYNRHVRNTAVKLLQSGKDIVKVLVR